MNRTVHQAKQDAKQAYVKNLEIMRAKLAKLNEQYADLVGDGTISDKINWCHVGDLGHLNDILGEALDFRLNHPKPIK